MLTVPRYANSVLVQPTWVITSSQASASTEPAIIETATAHYYVTGDTVRIEGHVHEELGRAPVPDEINGVHVITVVDATHFTAEVAKTTAGTGGTVTRVRPREPLTLDEGKLRAGFTWLPGDVREPLMLGWIATARQVVEHRTQLALLSQVRDLVYDVPPLNPLPPFSTPLRAVLTVAQTASDGSETTYPPEAYRIDYVNGRILALDANVVTASGGVGPTWRVRVVAGWDTPEAIPPSLLHAVGLLTAHFATLGRDLASTDAAVAVPYGFEEAIEPHALVTLA